MRNIFIFHGSYGNPQENWFPWLKKELDLLGHHTIVPTFPCPIKKGQGHNLDLWLNAFDQYKSFVNEETIFIAHSRGCTFTYHLIPFLGIKINSLFLVGAFADYDQWRPDEYKEYDSFQATPYLWKRIRQLANHIEVFQSTNDVIPVCEGQFVAHWLQAKLNIIENAGHFNTATYLKFIQFPELLDRIKLRL